MTHNEKAMQELAERNSRMKSQKPVNLDGSKELAPYQQQAAARVDRTDTVKLSTPRELHELHLAELRGEK